jgi:hypothetical protein
LKEIERLKSLYLTSLGELEDNVLRLIVTEARADGPTEDVRVGDVLITGSRAIVSDETCAAYEVIFPDYIAYSVRNESFTVRDDDEEYEGRLFCVYRKSKFLEYVREATIVSDKHPGPFKHYGINCLNHIVDVASTRAPEITRMRGAG